MAPDAKPTTSPSTSARTASDRPASRPKRRGGFRKLLPLAIVAVLVVAIVGGLWPKPIEVETATVSRGPLTVAVLEEGKTRVRHRYMISPPVAGQLNRIELRAGAPIEAGKTVLATVQAEAASFLNPRARAEAEARVKMSEAAKLRSDAEFERVKSSLDLAEKDRDRAQTLKAKGAIAVKDWDAAENQVAVLSRELRAAEFGKQVAEFEVAQAQAALKQFDAPGDVKGEPLKIVAPVSGFVLNVMEENARVVTPGMPIMEVGDINDIEAEIELLSSDAVGVQPGAEVAIERWGGERPLRGRVALVEPGGYTKVSALGVEEQRVKVRVDFAEPLPPNATLGDRFRVEARIVTWSSKDVLQVPTGALFRRGNEWMTFVIDGGRARLAKVEIAHNNGTAAEVRGGLSEKQTVILHPPDAVTEGSAVKARAEK